MTYAIVTTMKDGQQLCASGYDSFEKVRDHVAERVRLSALSRFGNEIKGFLVVGPDARGVALTATGICYIGKEVIQEWYKAEKTSLIDNNGLSN